MALIAAGILTAAALSAAQPDLPAPVLYCYARATETGTVARRAFKDATGHVVKEIFYAGPIGADGRPECSEATLRVQSIRTFEHDMDGRPILERVFGPDERIEQLSRLDYLGDSTQPARRVTKDPAGLLRSETRWRDGQEVTALWFDADGKVAAARGELPPGVPYAIRWGPPSDGWACAVGAVRREGAAEDVVPVVHLRNLTGGDAMARFVTRFDAELVDPDGRILRGRPSRVSVAAARPGRLLWPGEADHVPGPDVRQRFGRLAPGQYRLLAWHPHPDTGSLLECGTLDLTIK